MTTVYRPGFVALLLLGAVPAAAQSTLGGAGSLPPPQRPGAAPPAATAPAAPATPAAPAPPRRPSAQTAPRPSTPTTRPPAAAQQAAPVVRPPSRPDARPRGGAAAPQATRPGGQATTGNRGRAAAGAAAGAATGAGAAAARPPEPAQPSPPPEPQSSVGSVTSLPLPRFAALRSDEVNLRTGPGTRFPIEWTYQRRELPVEITREFELWRRIRDPDGTEGWVHQSTLMGRRSAIVRGAPGSETPLRRRPEVDAAPVARLRPGVIVRLRHCEAGNPWCEAQTGDYRGYIRRAELWGVMPDEEIK